MFCLCSSYVVFVLAMSCVCSSYVVCLSQLICMFVPAILHVCTTYVFLFFSVTLLVCARFVQCYPSILDILSGISCVFVFVPVTFVCPSHVLCLSQLSFTFVPAMFCVCPSYILCLSQLYFVFISATLCVFPSYGL